MTKMHAIRMGDEENHRSGWVFPYASTSWLRRVNAFTFLCQGEPAVRTGSLDGKEL